LNNGRIGVGVCGVSRARCWVLG